MNHPAGKPLAPPAALLRSISSCSCIADLQVLARVAEDTQFPPEHINWVTNIAEAIEDKAIELMKRDTQIFERVSKNLLSRVASEKKAEARMPSVPSVLGYAPEVIPPGSGETVEGLIAQASPHLDPPREEERDWNKELADRIANGTQPGMPMGDHASDNVMDVRKALNEQ